MLVVNAPVYGMHTYNYPSTTTCSLWCSSATYEEFIPWETDCLVSCLKVMAIALLLASLRSNRFKHLPYSLQPERLSSSYAAGRIGPSSVHNFHQLQLLAL